MADIYDATGALVASFDLPGSYEERLERGETVTYAWRTPRMLAATFGAKTGSFDLSRNDDGLIITADPDSTKEYAQLLTEANR